MHNSIPFKVKVTEYETGRAQPSVKVKIGQQLAFDSKLNASGWEKNKDQRTISCYGIKDGVQVKYSTHEKNFQVGRRILETKNFVNVLMLYRASQDMVGDKDRAKLLFRSYLIVLRAAFPNMNIGTPAHIHFEASAVSNVFSKRIVRYALEEFNAKKGIKLICLVNPCTLGCYPMYQLIGLKDLCTNPLTYLFFCGLKSTSHVADGVDQFEDNLYLKPALFSIKDYIQCFESDRLPLGFTQVATYLYATFVTRAIYRRNYFSGRNTLALVTEHGKGEVKLSSGTQQLNRAIGSGREFIGK